MCHVTHDPLVFCVPIGTYSLLTINTHQRSTNHHPITYKRTKNTKCIIVILFSACYSLRSVTLQFFLFFRISKKLHFLLHLGSFFSFSVLFSHRYSPNPCNFLKFYNPEVFQLHLISKLFISSYSYCSSNPAKSADLSRGRFPFLILIGIIKKYFCNDLGKIQKILIICAGTRLPKFF